MAACAHCSSRKGKRECPALRGKICPTCCGEHRQVEIDCPPDCVYLTSHESYQRKRIMDRAPREWIGRVVRYERVEPAAQLVFHETNLALCRHAAERGSLDRAATRDGLEFARRRMSLIETPEPYVPPFGEHLLKVLDELIKAQSPVEREGIRRVLDETLHHLDADVSDESFADYLGFLRAIYGDHLDRERSREKPSIILP